MKYLILFCGNPQDVEAWQALHEEERTQHEGRVSEWFTEHRFQIRGDHHYHAPFTATSMYFIPNDQPHVTDIACFEGMEVIGSYAEIEVADIDELLDLAKKWPLRLPALSVVEIRPQIE